MPNDMAGPWHRDAALTESSPQFWTGGSFATATARANTDGQNFGNASNPPNILNLGNVAFPVSSGVGSFVSTQPGTVTKEGAGWINGMIQWSEFDLDFIYNRLLDLAELDSVNRFVRASGSVALPFQAYAEDADFAFVSDWKFLITDFPHGTTLSRSLTPRILATRVDFNSDDYYWSEDDPDALTGLSYNIYTTTASITSSSSSSATNSSTVAAAAGLSFGQVVKDSGYDTLHAALTGAALQASFDPQEDETSSFLMPDPPGTTRGVINVLGAPNVVLSVPIETPALSLPDIALAANQPDLRFITTVCRIGPTLYDTAAGVPAYVPPNGANAAQGLTGEGVAGLGEIHVVAIYRPVDYRLHYTQFRVNFTDPLTAGDLFILQLIPPWDDFDGVIETSIDISWGDTEEKSLSPGSRKTTHIYQTAGIYDLTIVMANATGSITMEFTVVAGMAPLSGAIGAIGVHFDSIY